MMRRVTLIARRLFVSIIIASLWLGPAGCSQLRRQQRDSLRAWEAKGYKVNEYDEGKALFLGLLPGGGSLYTGAYAQGVADAFLWPVSVLWEPFLAAREAEARNYWATRHHVDSLKRKEMRRLLDRSLAGEIDQAQYVRERQLIEDKYAGSE